MTKKRFIALDEGYDFIIRDTITHNDLCDVESIIDVLNDYEKESELLKQQCERLSRLNETKKEQIKFHVDGYNKVIQTIQEAIKNERTEIGKSVLKQLLGQI